jgi:hypothetical protein
MILSRLMSFLFFFFFFFDRRTIHHVVGLRIQVII